MVGDNDVRVNQVRDRQSTPVLHRIKLITKNLELLFLETLDKKTIQVCLIIWKQKHICSLKMHSNVQSYINQMKYWIYGQ